MDSPQPDSQPIGPEISEQKIGRHTLQREERALLAFNIGVDALNLLYEAAVDGHDGALEVLSDLADKLNTRGGDWRAMKYIKSGG